MGKSSGIDPSVQQGELQVAQGELGLGQQANARAEKLFNTSFPGFAQAEQYYQTLASGDPAAIARAISPATQQITAQAEGAKQRISQDMPRGGAQNLALAENEINKGAQIGQAATGGYLSSFQNLAGLAGQGIGQAGQQTGAAISATGAAGNQYSNIANQQAEQKASQLGFISSLVGSGAEAAGAFCWIAEELFGEGAYETAMVRRYLSTYAIHHWFGRLCVALYRRFGRQVAAHIRTSMLWRGIWLRIFVNLYDHAVKVVPDEEKREIIEHYWDQQGGPRRAGYNPAA